MKKLDIGSVAPNISFPFKGGSTIFLQEAFTEIFKELLIERIGISYDVSAFYVIKGCHKSISGPNTTISAGSIFKDGVVYLVSSVTFPNPVGPNVIIGTLTTTQFTATNADPVLFTDGISRNVHNITKVVFSTGVSGSGSVDFLGLKHIGDWTTQTSSLGITFNGGTSTFVTSNSKYRIDGKTMHWSLRIYMTMDSVSSIDVDFPSELVTAGYFTDPAAGYILGVHSYDSNDNMETVYCEISNNIFSIKMNPNAATPFTGTGPDQFIEINTAFEIGYQ